MKHQAACYSLLEVPAGLSVCVEEIDGPPAVRSRLCCLGITPGTVMSIFPTSGTDMRRICVRGASLVLCRDVAQCIKCTVLHDDSCPLRCPHRGHTHPPHGKHGPSRCELERQN